MLYFGLVTWHLKHYKYLCKQFEKCACHSLQKLYKYFFDFFLFKYELKFFKDNKASANKTIEFLRERNCLCKTAPKCSLCNSSMTEIKWQALNDGKVWRYPEQKGQKLSIHNGSFWEKSKLPLKVILELAFFWALETPLHSMKELTPVSKPFIVQWFQYFHDVCSNWLVLNPQQFGDPNAIVEIDESQVAKCKYNCDRPRNDHWVFDGYPWTSGKGNIKS